MAIEAMLTVGIGALATVITVMWKRMMKFVKSLEERLKIAEDRLDVCENDRLDLWQKIAGSKK